MIKAAGVPFRENIVQFSCILDMIYCACVYIRKCIVYSVLTMMISDEINYKDVSLCEYAVLSRGEKEITHMCFYISQKANERL